MAPSVCGGRNVGTRQPQSQGCEDPEFLSFLKEGRKEGRGSLLIFQTCTVETVFVAVSQEDQEKRWSSAPTRTVGGLGLVGCSLSLFLVLPGDPQA